MTAVATRWLLLFHHIPPEPGYVRVKLRRRLARLGALALKNSVYVLPYRSDTLEDLQWLAEEIRGDGGEAVLCDTRLIDGVTDDELQARFDEQSRTRYADITKAARDTLVAHRSGDATAETRAGLGREHARLARHLDAAARIDFFDSAAGERARAAVEAVRGQSRPRREAQTQANAGSNDSPMTGRVWVTRADVFVDRMASAWLIRRFLDETARFKFVRGVRYTPLPDELRFDMPGGEYTHRGDRCTFETLCEQFSLADPGLVAIGEIVHDIDLKDEKYERVEIDGIVAVLRGIQNAASTDDERVSLAAGVFDGLYAQFRSRR